MITGILAAVWFFAFFIPFIISMEDGPAWPWGIWFLSTLLWIIPIFTGVYVENNQGQYKGYVTAVERNGAIFQGYNVYLKTELESSNEDIACINREDSALIERLRAAQEAKENITVEYRGVWQFKIGECPGSSWMVTKILTK
jgi:hypothetical protein